MERCKTCKFWEDGVCDRVDVLQSDEDDEDHDSPQLFLLDVRVSDDWGLVEKLRTGPEFGCVLHEKGTKDENF